MKPYTLPKVSRRRRGFMTLDAIVAMSILSLLTGVAIVALTRHNAGLHRLAQQRQAMRQAETVLTHLQTARQLPHDLIGQVNCTTMGQLKDVPTCAWVCVSSQVGDAKAQLVGIVPQSAVKNLPPVAVTPENSPLGKVSP